MTTMALEIEKNELIRRILEVNDMEILEKIKRVLLQEEKKNKCRGRRKSPLPDEIGNISRF